MAPVLPAETKPSERPSATVLQPTTIEESCMFLTAEAGSMSQPMTEALGTISTLLRVCPTEQWLDDLWTTDQKHLKTRRSHLQRSGYDLLWGVVSTLHVQSQSDRSLAHHSGSPVALAPTTLLVDPTVPTHATTVSHKAADWKTDQLTRRASADMGT